MRVGDVLNRTISAAACQRFRFAVAYLRLSGWDRLAVSLDSLLNRGGGVSGAVGIDQGITSLEALEALRQVSSDSTIYHTVSGFIYHPKLYLMSGEDSAVAIVGSANLTCDGLFRNVELATAVYLDFRSELDLEVYRRYDAFVSELLDPSNPNVQPIRAEVLAAAMRAGLLHRESRTKEPGPALRSRRARPRDSEAALRSLFPALHVPVAPPLRRTASPRVPAMPIVLPPPTVGTRGTFVMQLSAFDCSHRSGVPGTPEVLIPHAAVDFFPPLTGASRKYPDAVFDVVLNTPMGRERHSYRLWYYEERAVGTRIDEYRLRMDHDTIDQTAPGGGDLLVITKLPAESDPAYEVTVLPRSDPTFPAFLGLCSSETQGKRWGMLQPK